MKNMYRVTRPAWASMEKVEFRTILYATLAFLTFSELAQYLRNTMEPFKASKPRVYLIYELGWPILETIVLSFGCVALLWFYRKQRVGVYPRTFIYAFYMSKGAVTSGKSHVVDYCHVKPVINTGKIIVHGASYQWDNGKLSKRVGFKSNYVYGTQDDEEETTCHIEFTIDENQEERLYRHGVLQFRAVYGQEENDGKKGVDGYVGYLRSTQKSSELQDVEVRSKGYAELYHEGLVAEDDVHLALTRTGDVLFGRLDTLLRAFPRPALWPADDPMLPDNGVTLRKTNFWGHHIPTPQSVILKNELRPHIDKLLTKVLRLTGVDAEAIKEFKQFAISQAELESPDHCRADQTFFNRRFIARYRMREWIDCPSDTRPLPPHPVP